MHLYGVSRSILSCGHRATKLCLARIPTQPTRSNPNPSKTPFQKKKRNPPPPSPSLPKNPVRSTLYSHRHPPQECAACHAPLYRATHKFKSGCGWPAYFDSLPGAVTRHTDSTFGMARTEITCSKCGGHLGHVFKGEGYPTPTDERHCVNSVSLKFSSKEGGT